MKAAFRTPLTPREIERILAPATPDRIDCALLRYTAPIPEITWRNDDNESSPE